MEQKEILPKEIKELSLKRKYRVLDNGDVSMIEDLKNEVIWHGRDFISLFRELEKSKTNIEYQLSDKFKSKVKENLVKCNEEIKLVKPYIPQIDKTLREKYELEKSQATLKSIKGSIKGKVPNHLKDIIPELFDKLLPIHKKQFSRKEMQTLKELKENKRKSITPPNKKQ